MTESPVQELPGSAVVPVGARGGQVATDGGEKGGLRERFFFPRVGRCSQRNPAQPGGSGSRWAARRRLAGVVVGVSIHS